MSDPRPIVVVSAPGRTVPELRREAEAARAAGADAVEVRIDRLSSADRAELEGLFPTPVPLVATLRSRAEGGEGPDDPAERSEVLRAVMRLPFAFLDLEWERDRSVELPDPFGSAAVRIYSAHLTRTSPPDAVQRKLEELDGAPGFGKLIMPAGVGYLLRDLAPLLASLEDGSVTLLTTGPSGPLLRAWSGALRLPLVYAALPESAGASPPVETSQVPVDRLLPFARADRSRSLFAVVGRPVAHSLSPRLHHRWMGTTGRVGLYVALEMGDEEEFVGALGPLADRGFRGLNITHPFKAVARDAATRVAPGASACGVANCLTLDGGEVEADNTDLAAAMRRLTELRQAGRWDGDELAVLGTGGAARATLAAARALGAEAEVFARRPESAHAVAKEFGAGTGSAHDDHRFALVVQATSAGREAEPSLDIPVERLLRDDAFVLDWVYAPSHRDVQGRVERVGATYEDGRRLLVYQAASSFALWWGEELPPEAVDRAIEEVGTCAA